MAKCDNYRVLAKYYDFFTLRALSSCRRRINDVCRENGVRRVADLACGTGALAFSLWRESGIKVTGIDSSPAMLARSMARLEEERGALISSGYDEDMNAAPEFILGRAEATPFADQSFELAALSLALHETSASPAGLVEEAARIADKVLILDYRLAERNLELPAAFLAHIPEFLAGGEHYANFRKYMRKGALQGLLHRVRKTLGLHCLREWSCCGGALGLALCGRKHS